MKIRSSLLLVLSTFVSSSHVPCLLEVSQTHPQIWKQYFWKPLKVPKLQWLELSLSDFATLRKHSHLMEALLQILNFDLFLGCWCVLSHAFMMTGRNSKPQLSQPQNSDGKQPMLSLHCTGFCCAAKAVFFVCFLDVVLRHPTVSSKGPSVSPAVYVNSEYMCSHCFPFVVQGAVNSRGQSPLIRNQSLC